MAEGTERPGGNDGRGEGGKEGEAGEGREAGDGPGLESRLRRLQEIVSLLEADDVDLERALALFEEGVGHVREAEGLLARAELRVEELLGEGTAGTTRPLVIEG